MANDKEYLTFEEAVESLHLKFQSGNSIEVERATITRKEWDALLPILTPYINAKKSDIVLPHTIKVV